MIKPIYISLFLLLIVSCHRDSKPLEGHYYTSSNSRRSVVNPDLKNVEMGPYLASESFMDFFKNGTYTLNLNHFESGNYSFQGDTIYLSPIDGEPWKIRFLDDKKEIGHFEYPAAGRISTLNKLPCSLDKDYPFTTELNQWRLVSKNELSTNELIEKFQNYASFMQTYMRWAKNNSQRLSFKQISGPLQYANNGLMMRKLKHTGTWCSYFVEGDCDRMDKILRHYFDGLIIDWQYTNNRIAMLIDALGQVSKGIENHKEYFEE